MEFVLTRNNFCNWCWSSSYWDFFNRKAGFNTRLCLSETVSAVSFLETLRYLREAFEIPENGTSAKKVTLGDGKDCRDKICIEVETTSDNAGGQPKRGFSLQHKTFSALNYAQDFGTTVKESLKRTTSTKWATLTKSRIVPCQILSCLCRHSQPCLDLPSVQTVIEFTNWIPKIMVQFSYLRLYFGTDNVSRRLLQRIASH